MRRGFISTCRIAAGLIVIHAAIARAADDFETRRKVCFDAVAASYKPGGSSAHNAFWRAEAFFELGKADEGRALVGRGLDQLTPGNRENRWNYGGNSGFIAWPGIDCYIRYTKYLDDPLKERYRKIYTGAVIYKRLTTSNHKMMAAVTRYLATQVWGDNAFAPDPWFIKNNKTALEKNRYAGTYFTADDPTGEKYCRERIAAVLKSGPEEYASRPYGAQNVLPLLSLAECAADGNIREAATKAYAACIAELAPAYLHGHLATFSTRSYPDVISQQPSGVAAVLWAYFGGAAPGDISGQPALRAVTSNWRPSTLVIQAGTERTRPYVYRSHMSGWALYHYVTPGYALFSRSAKASHPRVLGQNYPCGIMWDEPDPILPSFLWITNPAADSTEPGSLNNPRGIHTHGVTNAERQVQCRGTMLSVYNISPDFRNPYVLGFVPPGYGAMINLSGSSGRIFLAYRSVLIAITASQPFQWDPASGIRAPATNPPAGSSEFRVQAARCAVAIETAAPDAYPGGSPQEKLDAFAKAVEVNSRLKLDNDATAGPVADYADREGHALRSVFNGEDSIDSKRVDYSGWPLIESPWYSQIPNS